LARGRRDRSWLVRDAADESVADRSTFFEPNTHARGRWFETTVPIPPHRALVRRDVERIFDYRRKAVARELRPNG
jgi:hypothetical protein